MAPVASKQLAVELQEGEVGERIQCYQRVTSDSSAYVLSRTVDVVCESELANVRCAPQQLPQHVTSLYV